MDCRCVIAYSLVFLRFLAWSLLKSWNRALVIFVLVPVHFCRCFASCSLVRGFQTFAICKKCTAGMAVHRMGVGCILSALRPHCMCLSVCLFLSQLVQVWDFLHMIKVSSEHSGSCCRNTWRGSFIQFTDHWRVELVCIFHVCLRVSAVTHW